MTAGLTLASAPAVATVRQESRSAPAPAAAAARSHKEVADYLTIVTEKDFGLVPVDKLPRPLAVNVQDIPNPSSPSLRCF